MLQSLGSSFFRQNFNSTLWKTQFLLKFTFFLRTKGLPMSIFLFFTYRRWNIEIIQSTRFWIRSSGRDCLFFGNFIKKTICKPYPLELWTLTIRWNRWQGVKIWWKFSCFVIFEDQTMHRTTAIRKWDQSYFYGIFEAKKYVRFRLFEMVLYAKEVARYSACRVPSHWNKIMSSRDNFKEWTPPSRRRSRNWEDRREILTWEEDERGAWWLTPRWINGRRMDGFGRLFFFLLCALLLS